MHGRKNIKKKCFLATKKKKPAYFLILEESDAQNILSLKILVFLDKDTDLFEK